LKLVLLTSLRLRIECKIGRRYAAVFPDPVFALARISFPAIASGMAVRCTRVGFSNFCCAIPWRMRASRPKSTKVSIFGTAAASPETGIGTSFKSNFRFMVAIYIECPEVALGQGSSLSRTS
jgi:hypothetical protein